VARWMMGQLTMTGSHRDGYVIEGWTDGQTQARIRWKGEGSSEVIERVTITARGTVGLLGDISNYGDLELVSAVLEPYQI